MHIVLMFFKIIGIILLVLVLLTLALLLIVMCTPLRYRIQGEYHDEKPDVQAKLSIWFSALAAYVTFTEEGLSVYFRIFGMRKKLPEPALKEKNMQAAAKTEEGYALLKELEEDANPPDKTAALNEAENAAAEKRSGEAAREKTTAVMSGEAAKEQDIQEKYSVLPDGIPSEEESNIKVCTVVSEPEKQAEEGQQTEKPEPENARISASHRLNGVLDKLKRIYNKVQEMISKLLELYHSVKRKEKAVIWFLDEASTKHVINVLKKQIVKILKSILPRKLTGDLRIGMENPAVMGQICMFGSMFYPMYEKYFSFTPVFGEKVIEGKFFLKGRIILGAILAHAVRILLMRDFYRFIKNVKKLMRRLK